METTLGDVQCLHLDASPAACVLFALTSGVVGPFDLCVSGVNAGENLGAGLTISGTFGAALEAQVCGVRAIALSREYEDGDLTRDPLSWDWTDWASTSAEVLKWCLLQTGWQLVNVAIPSGADAHDIASTKISRQSYFRDRYDDQAKVIVSEIGFDPESLDPDDDIAVFAVERRVSVTLLSGVLQ
jgi:5'/3'-nucleotidase SurE